MGEPELLQRLSLWLAARRPDLGRPTLAAIGKPGSGYSAENLVIEASWEHGPDQKLVLRRETPDPPIYPAQSPGSTTGVVMQHGVMEALRGNGRVPVAESLGLEADPDVLGVPFFVMAHVQGEVPGEDPPYTTSGFFVDAPADRRARLLASGLETVARIHQTDIGDPGLTPLGSPEGAQGAARQLEVWEICLRAALAGRTSTLIEASLDWLRDRVPEAGPPGFSWGDARPGNMIFRDGEVACVTDFEGAALGPRELDVGWWLMCDRWMHEVSGVGRLPGEPDRPAQRVLYEQAAGVALGDTTWYEIFSALRFATTVVLVMNRWVARGAVAADQVIWRDNPATEVLAQLVEEARP